MKNSVIISDKEIMGGTPVFKGTRVPVQALFDFMGGGDTLEDFLRSFPSVKKKQAVEVLRLADKYIHTLAINSENYS